MAVMHAFVWTPSEDVMARRLLVEAEDREAFRKSFLRAREAYAPRAWVQALSIAAMGDDFVMLSGEWLEGARVVAALSGADRVWAYVATAGEGPTPADPNDVLEAWWLRSLGGEAVRDAAQQLAAAMPCGAEGRIRSISPETLPDWPVTERTPILRLVDAPGVSLTDECELVPHASEAGLLVLATHAGCRCKKCSSGACHRMQ